MSVESLKDGGASARTRKLVVLSQDAYVAWLAAATPVQKKYCATPGFNGKAGQVQPVYVNDEVDHYIAVIGDAASPHGYTALPGRLPPGEYFVTDSSKDVDHVWQDKFLSF